MKARATLPRGRETVEGMIDNAIQLWTRMTINDAERDSKYVMYSLVCIHAQICVFSNIYSSAILPILRKIQRHNSAHAWPLIALDFYVY